MHRDPKHDPKDLDRSADCVCMLSDRIRDLRIYLLLKGGMFYENYVEKNSGG